VVVAAARAPAVAGVRGDFSVRASAFPEEFFELAARAVDLSGVGGCVGLRPRLEVIAEVGACLVAHFLRGGLAAMLGDAGIVVDAHAAYVQLGPTLRALIETPQWQGERRERDTALPADEVMGHARRLLQEPQPRTSHARCLRRAAPAPAALRGGCAGAETHRAPVRYVNGAAGGRSVRVSPAPRCARPHHLPPAPCRGSSPLPP